MLRDVVGFDNLKKAVVNPLKGKKIAAYYGCLLLRPGKVMEFDDPENPKIMEEFHQGYWCNSSYLLTAQ